MLKKASLLVCFGLLSASSLANSLADGRYVIYSKLSGLALDVESASQENGGNVQQWGYSGGEWQQFDVAYQGDNDYSIRAVHSGKALEVFNMSSETGANIEQWDFWGGENQLWRIDSLGNGYYTLISKLSGQAADVWKWSTQSGGDIRQYTVSHGDNQQFRFVPVSGSGHDSETPDGFAAQDGGTTGGAGGDTVTVNSCPELESALSRNDAVIVQIPNKTIDCRTAPRQQTVCPVQCAGSNEYTYRVPVGSQTCLELGSSSNATTTKNRNDKRIIVQSNKSIIGLGPQSTVQGGAFIVGGKSNLIFRNFTITDINPKLVEASGGISMDNAEHIWIDHMAFSQISDGYTDMKNVRNITLSWNHFDGHNTASCDDHHSYVMYADDSTVTFHHNFFDLGGGRNPKLNKAATRAHLYNNYWKDITFYATSVSNGAQALIEGNYYQDVQRPHWNTGGSIDARKDTNVYAGNTPTSTGAETGDRVFQDVSLYHYSLDKAQDLPAILSSQTGPK